MRFLHLLLLVFTISIFPVNLSHTQESRTSVSKQSTGSWQSFTSLSYAPTIISDDDSLWIGGGGIRQYNLQKGTMNVFHTEDGLISNAVTSIAQDRQTKELWIGTADGVSRFNTKTGYWRSYTIADGLIDNYVQAVAICHFGDSTTIWFGTRKGLSVFDSNKLEWESVITENEGGLRDNWITCLAVDEGRGLLWVGTAKGIGLYDLKKQEWKSGTIPSVTMWIEKLIVENKTGNVWCATFSQGIKRYNTTQAVWSDLSYRSKPFDALCLALDEKNDLLWIGAEDGLWSCQLSSGKMVWKKIGASQRLDQAGIITSILISDQQLKVWFATDKGIYQYDGGAQRGACLLRNAGPAHNDVNKLALGAQSDTLWLATDGGGISSYGLEDKTWRSYTKENGLFSRHLKSLSLNGKDNSLWFGSLQGVGVFHYVTERVKRIGAMQGLNDANVVAIATDEEKGIVWIGVWGSAGGLYRYDLKNGRMRAFKYTQGLASNSITSLALDGDIVWIGTGSGVSRYDSKADKWRTLSVQDGLSNSAVVTLAVDKKHDSVWVATEWGLNRYDKRQDRWQQFFKKEDGLAHHIVLAVAVDEVGDTVWFGTEGFGVTRYDLKADRWTTFTTRDGLASNYVLSMAIDRKRQAMWFGTVLGGVSCFSYR